MGNVMTRGKADRALTVGKKLDINEVPGRGGGGGGMQHYNIDMACDQVATTAATCLMLKGFTFQSFFLSTKVMCSTRGMRRLEYPHLWLYHNTIFKNVPFSVMHACTSKRAQVLAVREVI